MLNIVCVKQGTAYGPEYVNILRDMVRRNLPEGYPGRFICFTDDDASGLDEGIEARSLPSALKGWWAKLWLFKAGHFADGERVLYFDLDTVIAGALDRIATYDGQFAILRDFYRPNGLQSSVMGWRAGFGDFVWNEWEHFRRPHVDGGDQTWIEIALSRNGIKPDLWQQEFPGAFVSYKVHCDNHPPKTARVVVFHGEPKPHNCDASWVKALWQIGGGSAFSLEQVCNTEHDALLDNVRFSLARGLHWPCVFKQPPHDAHAIIVGGGPSLLSKLEELKRRVADGARIFATNNTANWLRERGFCIYRHVILDARPENKEFLCRIPTVTMLASQCHPEVFERAAERNIIMVWHPLIEGIAELVKDDPRPVHLVGGGSTVGLKAIVLAWLEGYRTFHLYGMDSSYSEEGAHHAYEQSLNDGERVLDVQAGERKFKAAPWMVSQANEFQELAAFLANEGCTITVAGDGLLQHVAREMMNAPPTAADIRAHAILSRLPEGDTTGAEIGVFAGDLSARLLARDNLTLYMIDSWRGDGTDYTDKEDWHASLSQAQQDAYRRHAEAVTAFAGDRAKVICAESAQAAAQIEDGSLDFVFIDADHSYEGCARDIALWSLKLRPGGILSGHDYENVEFAHFGVTRAVDEYATRTGLKLELGDNFTWFIVMPQQMTLAA